MKRGLISLALGAVCVAGCATVTTDNADTVAFNPQNLSADQVVAKLDKSAQEKALHCYAVMDDVERYVSSNFPSSGHYYKSGNVDVYKQRVDFSKLVWRKAYKNKFGKELTALEIEKANLADAGSALIDAFMLKNMNKREEKRIEECNNFIDEALLRAGV